MADLISAGYQIDSLYSSNYKNALRQHDSLYWWSNNAMVGEKCSVEAKNAKRFGIVSYRFLLTENMSHNAYLPLLVFKLH